MVRGFDFANLDRGFKLEVIVIPKPLVVVDSLSNAWLLNKAHGGPC